MIRRLKFLLALPVLTILALPAVLAAQPAAAADPFVAVVTQISPLVTVQRANSDRAVPLKADDRLYPGDRIICGEGGRASLIFADTAVELKLLPDSELTLQGQRNNGSIVKRLYLRIGKLLTRVVRGDMEVVTPTCVASVKGTRWWTTVDRTEVTQVIVLEGEVKVQNRISGTTNLVGVGNTATSNPGGLQQVGPSPKDEIPSESTTPDKGSLEIDFNDGSGHTKTLQIDFDR